MNLHRKSRPILATAAGRLSAAFVAVLALLSAPAHADFITIDGRDFTPLLGNAPYSESATGNLGCSGGSGQNQFSAQLHLPPIALTVRGLAAWGTDLSSENLSVRLVRVCQELLVGSVPQRTQLAGVSTSGTPTQFFVQNASLNTRVEDQDRCVYLVEAQFGLNSCDLPATLNLTKVRVRFEPLPDNLFADGFESVGP